MAFKMKNPSVAKMVKMAGNNRTAMKMKAEEAAAMKMKKAAMKLKEEAAMKMKKEAAMKLKEGKGTKKVDMPDFASTKQVKAKTGGNAKNLDKSEIKSPTKLRKPEPKRKKDQPKEKSVDVARKKVGDTSRPKGSATKMKKDDSSMKMKKGEAMKMKKSAMKLDEADKKKAIENAMPAAEKEVLSSSTVAGMKKYFGGVNTDYDAVRAKLLKARKSGDNNYQEMRKIAKARYPNLTRML